MNKIIQMIRSIPNNCSFKNIPKKNENLYKLLAELTTGIGDSNGSAYYDKAEIRVGIITDEFMYNYYKDAIDLVIISHDTYKETIDNEDLDMVMYVSCWRGMCDNDWYGDNLHGDVPKAVKYANEKGITTIFQSIEDPTNYDRYLPIAKECDYIFTTDADCIERYKKDTGNQDVFLLEYGINPIFHNPIGINHKYYIENNYDYSTVFFAGSWMDRYKNRCRDISMIFKGVINSGKNLMIADRNIEVKLPGYKFPRRYRPFVVPAIEHALLQKVHKLFKFSININTVQDSPTMCAMRAYELQGLGVPILTNYSLALSENFPGMFMINNSEEVQEIINKYTDKELYRIQVDNLRNVMSKCTVFDRLNYIFEKCAVNYSFPEKRVIVLCKEKTDNIRRMFNGQTYTNKVLLTEDCYYKVDNEDGFVTYFDDENNYGENYLTDMINAFKYCNVEFVTKNDGATGNEYNFVKTAHSIYSTVLTCDKYEEIEKVDNVIIEGNGFKIDSFELNETVSETSEDKKIAVIVPIYNNGRYLRERCFRSLLRSSIFDKMQIYLIDDGSDDEETIKIIKNLESKYDNITTYFFEKGGSGSAARPRNKGVEISVEPYITYLDPDNEAINDGYYKLFNNIEKTNADMAFGAIFMRSNSDKLVRMGYLFKNELISNPKKLLIEENFRSQSVQACLIKREVIVENKLKNPEGAFGEDTLFFHELMLNADNVYYLNEHIHIYYAQRSDSSINDIGKSFFEKSLILEQYQEERFKEYGIFEEYVDRKLDYFVVNWYLEKLKNVIEEDRDECIEIIDRIVKIYGKTIEDYKAYLREIE